MKYIQLFEEYNTDIISKSLSDTFFEYYKYGERENIKIYNKILDWLYNQILDLCDELRNNKLNTEDFLNTENWGIKKDGNLAVFDIGFGDYFDEFENENLPMNLDLEEDNNILTKILAKYGLNKSKYIGSGAYGHAHDIGNGKVLKITTDKSEAVNSKKIINKDLTHVAKIYSVNYFIMNDKTYYVIILEKLKLSKKLTNDYKELEKYFDDKRTKHLDKNIITKIGNKHSIVSNFLKDMTKIGYQETWDKWGDELREKDYVNKYDFNDISEISNWIKGSVTNNNSIEDEPPHYVTDLVSSLTQ